MFDASIPPYKFRLSDHFLDLLETYHWNLWNWGRSLAFTLKPGGVMLYDMHMMTTWASYQICKIAGCACAGNTGNVFPRRRLQKKPLVSDPGMHHGTCVTHVPWCMSGSLTRGGGENVPGIPGACAPAIFRIWQETHDMETLFSRYRPFVRGPPDTHSWNSLIRHIILIIV